MSELPTTEDLQNLRERAKRVLLHEPPGGDPDKLTLVRASGSLVWDDTGKQYIDCTAQAWSNNLGALFQSALQLIERFLGAGESWFRHSCRCQQRDGETTSCHGVLLREREYWADRLRG